MPIWGVHDKPCKDCSLAYPTLLNPFPSIGMGQNKVDVTLDRFPEDRRVGILNVSAGAVIEVFHEISKDLDRRFISRKRWKVVIVDVGRGQMFRTKMQFPPIR